MLNITGYLKGKFSSLSPYLKETLIALIPFRGEKRASEYYSGETRDRIQETYGALSEFIRSVGLVAFVFSILSNNTVVAFIGGNWYGIPTSIILGHNHAKKYKQSRNIKKEADSEKHNPTHINVNQSIQPTLTNSADIKYLYTL